MVEPLNCENSAKSEVTEPRVRLKPASVIAHSNILGEAATAFPQTQREIDPQNFGGKNFPELIVVTPRSADVSFSP